MDFFVYYRLINNDMENNVNEIKYIKSFRNFVLFLILEFSFIIYYDIRIQVNFF